MKNPTRGPVGARAFQPNETYKPMGQEMSQCQCHYNDGAPQLRVKSCITTRAAATKTKIAELEEQTAALRAELAELERLSNCAQAEVEEARALVEAARAALVAQTARRQQPEHTDLGLQEAHQQ